MPWKTEKQKPPDGRPKERLNKLNMLKVDQNISKHIKTANTLEIEVCTACTALNLPSRLCVAPQDQVRTLERELQQLRGRRDAWNQVEFPVRL